LTRTYFITGVGTNVGKTWATLAIMRKASRLGYRVAGMKPVAAGCKWLDGELKNDDALLIQANCSQAYPYQMINPCAFELALSPHLASNGEEPDLSRITAQLQILKQQADLVLVEGAGGWLSPISMTQDNAGLAAFLQLPVIFVVDI
jgi:dethiobiotin synthetase